MRECHTDSVPTNLVLSNQSASDLAQLQESPPEMNLHDLNDCSDEDGTFVFLLHFPVLFKLADANTILRVREFFSSI